MPEDRPKSKKPANTAFKQQRLKAWQPILTPKTVLPTFFLVGTVFVPLGIGLYIASDRVNEIMFDYTACQNGGAFAAPITNWTWNPTNLTCTIDFEVPTWFSPPVFLYYRLTNFYQNHRRYVKSFDAKQLKGETISAAASCDPLRTLNTNVIANGVNTSVSQGTVYPCGLIANSMFSDEISDLTCIQSDQDFNGQRCTDGVVYVFSPNGISWPSDKEKYGTISSAFPRAEDIPTTIVPPPLWRDSFPKWKDGYNISNLPDLREWERFQVWMRTAALPNFRKLWGRNTQSALAPGIWQIRIRDTFKVEKFSGTKAIVISTVSVLGGKNPFLGVAYITVGVICWVLGLAFLIRHMIKPRKLGDHTYLSWNQPQPTQPRAAGAPEVGGERSSLMNSR